MKFVQVFLAVLIVIGVGLLATQKFWVPKLVDHILIYEETRLAASIGDTCHETQSYYGIEKHLGDSVTTKILVKYKASPDQHFKCIYSVAKGDFEITNGEADHLLTFTNNFLVLDRGTAPEPRGLMVYDLHTRKQVYTDRYATPWGGSGDTITYWSPVATKPTANTCPKLGEYTKQGLGAVIEDKVTLDLSTLTKKDSGESRCMATQSPTPSPSPTISADDALKKVSSLPDVQNFLTGGGNPHIGVSDTPTTDPDTGATYWVVQVYENLGDHNSTFGWYRVDTVTGEVTSDSQ